MSITKNTSLDGNLENVQPAMDLEDTTTAAVQDVPGAMGPDEKNINPNDLSFFFVYQRENSVVFWIRVNGKIDAKNRIEIPKEDFHSPACVLDFNDVEIIDDGRTVRFGQYECSAESVLEYKYNPDKYTEEEKVFD